MQTSCLLHGGQLSHMGFVIHTVEWPTIRLRGSTTSSNNCRSGKKLIALFTEVLPSGDSSCSSRSGKLQLPFHLTHNTAIVYFRGKCLLSRKDYIKENLNPPSVIEPTVPITSISKPACQHLYQHECARCVFNENQIHTFTGWAQHALMLSHFSQN